MCGADAKVPNVRGAEAQEEVDALDERLGRAEQDATARKCLPILNDFRNAVSKSQAVICRPLGIVSELVSSDNSLFGTFYQAINRDARLPEDNEWDRIRQAVDSLLFPYYFEHIRFGALSIDGTGVTSYGEYSVILKDMAIRDRATVFEENTAMFVKHHQIVPGNQLPIGYKAVWSGRDKLAGAKLHSFLHPGIKAAEYQSILINLSNADPDFIEVHIYGPLHRKAIASVAGPEPRRKADKVVYRSMLRKLKDIGVI